MKIYKTLLFLTVFLSACAAYDSDFIPKSLQHPLSGQIQTIDAQRRRLIKLVQKKKVTPALQQEILQLQDFFAVLPRTAVPFEREQDRDLLKTYCELGQRILQDLVYHLQRKNWSEAQQAIDRIRSMEQNLLRDFANSR